MSWPESVHTCMQLDVIDQFVKKNFRKASLEDRQELVNAGWIYLYETGCLDSDDLTDDVAKDLKEHLEEVLNPDDWREVPVGGKRGSIVTDASGAPSDDEALTYHHRKTKIADLSVIKEELEAAAAMFETRRDKLAELLPPVLFDALESTIFGDTDARYAKYEKASEKLLCRRALLRIGWIA